MEESEYCCEAMKVMSEEYDWPFYRPLMIGKNLKDISVAPLSIKLMKRTPAGNISKKGGATVIMHFCPVCGTELVPLEG